MDTTYGRRRIRRIGNYEYAFSCEDLALIRHISFLGYDILKKISLEVGIEQVGFNANNGTSPLTISPVYVMNDYHVIDDLGGLEDLEEILMNEDVGNFLEENRLLPNFDYQKAISFFPSNSTKISKDSFKKSQDSNNDMSIGDFEIDDLWDDLDSRILIRDNEQTKPEFFTSGIGFYNTNLTISRGNEVLRGARNGNPSHIAII
nr:hypothetical protein [Tanacetum cinerariifolium]